MTIRIGDEATTGKQLNTPGERREWSHTHARLPDTIERLVYLPAGLKRQGRLCAWIAGLNQQKDQVEYGHIKTHSLQPRLLHHATTGGELAHPGHQIALWLLPPPARMQPLHLSNIPARHTDAPLPSPPSRSLILFSPSSHKRVRLQWDME